MTGAEIADQLQIIALDVEEADGEDRKPLADRLRALADQLENA